MLGLYTENCWMNYILLPNGSSVPFCRVNVTSFVTFFSDVAISVDTVVEICHTVK